MCHSWLAIDLHGVRLFSEDRAQPAPELLISWSLTLLVQLSQSISFFLGNNLRTVVSLGINATFHDRPVNGSSSLNPAWPRMEKSTFRDKSKSSSRSFPGSTLLAFMPIFVFFYILLVLPFLPYGGDRPENILYWPLITSLTLGLVLLNLARVDIRFFRSLPILSLIAYFFLSVGSLSWA